MLRWRLISGLTLVALLTVTCYLDVKLNFGLPGIWLLPLCLAIGVLAIGEMLDLFKAQNLRPDAASAYVGTLLVVAAACMNGFWPAIGGGGPLALGELPLLAMAVGVVVAFLAEMRRYEKPGGVIVAVALAVLIMVYVGVLMSFLVLLRVEIGIEQGNEQGMAALLSVVLVVKFSDIGAYASGRLFGRRKLVPRLSPGKTIEGVIGGVAMACFGSWLMFFWLGPSITGSPNDTPWWGWLAYAVALTAAGIVGDLAESLLKRDMNRRDSSTWLPGLGGVLDFMDSLLVAAPLAYLFWSCGLVRL